MGKIYGNYSPPCWYILHQLLKCSSEAELHLNRASFDICIPKLSGKWADQILNKTSSKPPRTQCPVLTPFTTTEVTVSLDKSLLLALQDSYVTAFPPKFPISPTEQGYLRI